MIVMNGLPLRMFGAVVVMALWWASAEHLLEEAERAAPQQRLHVNNSLPPYLACNATKKSRFMHEASSTQDDVAFSFPYKNRLQIGDC